MIGPGQRTFNAEERIMKMNDSSKAIMQNGGGDPVIFCLKVMGQGNVWVLVFLIGRNCLMDINECPCSIIQETEKNKALTASCNNQTVMIFFINCKTGRHDHSVSQSHTIILTQELNTPISYRFLLLFFSSPYPGPPRSGVPVFVLGPPRFCPIFKKRTPFLSFFHE